MIRPAIIEDSKCPHDFAAAQLQSANKLSNRDAKTRRDARGTLPRTMLRPENPEAKTLGSKLPGPRSGEKHVYF